MKKNLHFIIMKPARKAVCVAIAAVAALSFTASALSPDYYASMSKLNDGKWVKVKTTGEGIHQISYETLRGWGFSNPEKVNVYGCGATVFADANFNASLPDDITLSYTHHEEDKIYFYSTGMTTVTLSGATTVEAKENYYSADVFYLLSDRPVSKDEILAPVEFTAKGEPLDRHLSVSYTKENQQNPSDNGGAYMLGRTIERNGEVEIIVTVTDMATGGTHSWNKASLNVGFGALNYGSSTALPVRAPSGVTVGSTDYSSASACDSDDGYARYTLGSTKLNFTYNIPDGTYRFQAQHPNQYQRFLATDYNWFVYPRANNLRKFPQLCMYFYNMTEGENISLKAPATTRLMNVSNPLKQYMYNSVFDEETTAHLASLTHPAGTSGELTEKIVAFDVASQLPEVEYIGEVENQNFHGCSTPDMVILTTADLMEAALDLARIHREHDNKEVLVVQHDKLFNEFSGGTPDLMAYRRFLKMLYDRDSSKLKHIILYGRSHWDNRGLISLKKDRLFVYETTNPVYSGWVTTNFATDAILGMLNDNFSVSSVHKSTQQVAVGRIPASSVVTGLALNRKIESYLNYPHQTGNYEKILVISDDGDRNLHLNQAEGVISNMQGIRNSLSVVKAHNSIMEWDNKDAKDLRRLSTNTLKEGPGLYIYVGHGNHEAFGAEALWNRNYVDKTDYDRAPFGVLATCYVFNIDSDATTIGCDMIEKDNGGMMALIGTGREVFSSYNSQFLDAVASEYAKADSETTVGEIWLRARNSIVSSGGIALSLNTTNYNLGGDPSLKVYAPDYKVEISELSVAEGATVRSLESHRVRGRIVNKNGRLIDDFSGAITLQVYDAPYEVPVLIRDQSSDLPKNVKLEQDIIMSKTVEVTNGYFDAEFALPVPMHESELMNKMTFYADAADGRRADGMINRFAVKAETVAPSDDDESLGAMPEIALFRAEQDIDGSGTLTGSVRLVANGTVGPKGMNMADGLNAGSSILIDGMTRLSNVRGHIRMAPDNSWSLVMDAGELTAGYHSAKLTIADNAGRSAVSVIGFNVGEDANFSLTADRETVRDLVTFDVENALDDAKSQVLVIEDRHGKQIFYGENISFPYTMDMSKIDNLPNGHFNAYVKMTGASGNASSQRLPLTFVRRPAKN